MPCRPAARRLIPAGSREEDGADVAGRAVRPTRVDWARLAAGDGWAGRTRVWVPPAAGAALAAGDGEGRGNNIEALLGGECGDGFGGRDPEGLHGALAFDLQDFVGTRGETGGVGG
jgi:hypothetical protein